MSFQTSTVLNVSNAIKRLKDLETPEYESEECLKLFKLIDSSFADENSRTVIAKIMCNYGYPAATAMFMNYYAARLYEGENIWPCCFHLLRSLWNFSDSCDDLAVKCTDLLPFLVFFLTDDTLDPENEEEDEKLLKLVLNLMNNIAHRPETKVVFQEFQVAKMIKTLSKIQHEHLKVLIYLVLAQIVTENEFEALNDPSNEVIENISFYIKRSLQADNRRYRGISTCEYMDCMAKLAVTKDNQIKMIKCGMLDICKSVLSSNVYNMMEQLNTLTFIWNICFNENIRNEVKNNEELLGLIIAINNKSESDKLRHKASGILFTVNDLQKKENEKAFKQSIDQMTGNFKKPHIMISYNSHSREVCTKIKDELQSRGYDVWIDVENIYGSSLAAMAEAVENSAVFLMCVTEEYYMSPNCRLEAEYATKLGKPIVPLIMQSGYMPLGWLGIIMGDKIYYKFCPLDKLKFDQTFPSMLKEVTRHYGDDGVNSVYQMAIGDNVEPIKKNLAIENSPKPIKKIAAIEDTIKPQMESAKISELVDVSKWTIDDVKNWTENLKLSPWIFEENVFKDIDGYQLKELSEMKVRAPETYYTIIKTKLTKKNDHFQLSDILKFSNELTELCQC